MARAAAEPILNRASVRGQVSVRKCRLSDHLRELGECCRQALLWRGVGAEFVVAAAEVLCERSAGGDPAAERNCFSPRIRRSHAFNRA